MFRNTALFICDLQKRVLPRIVNSKAVVQNTSTILQCNDQYRKHKQLDFDLNFGKKLNETPVLFAEFLPHKLGNTDSSILSKINEKDRIIYHKQNYSMFDNNIHRLLKKYCVSDVVLAGVQSEWCITQTALDLRDHGFDVHILQDAVSTQSDFEHQEAIDRLKKRDFLVTTTHGWITEKMRIADHPVTKWYVNHLKENSDF